MKIEASQAGWCLKRWRWLLSLSVVSLGIATILGSAERAIADHHEAPIVFVRTSGDMATTHGVAGYQPPRFSNIVGSGRLILNAEGMVTGYYFTVSGLEANATYAYHFHGSGGYASCEGDKNLVPGESGAGVITNLGNIAPLTASANGIAILGSATTPIALPQPVALSDIGYLNLHPMPSGQVGPGSVCANVRLNPGGFVR